MAKKYWSCLIGGEIGELPQGSDLPLRIAVRHAFLDLTGEVDEVCASGWGINEERYELLRRLQSLPTEELKEIWENKSRRFTLKNRD